MPAVVYIIIYRTTLHFVLMVVLHSAVLSVCVILLYFLHLPWDVHIFSTHIKTEHVPIFVCVHIVCTWLKKHVLLKSEGMILSERVRGRPWLPAGPETRKTNGSCSWAMRRLFSLKKIVQSPFICSVARNYKN